MMKTIDLFCGCGGMSLGFQNIGFEIVLAVDNWEPALNIYRRNFKHDAVSSDLRDVKGALKLLQKCNADLIMGGPPCQDFSHAGKRNEDLGRGDLTVSFAKIVASFRPKYFVMENVDRLVKTRKYARAFRILKEADYGITVELLDASRCGVPQIRKRYFVIGEKGGEDGALSYVLRKNLAAAPMTVRDYFSNELDTRYYYRHPRNYNRRAIFSINEPSPTIRGVNRPIPNGYPGHPNDATKDMKKVRPLTTLERSYIQTFPKEFFSEGSKADLEQMVGNAVPVKLAEYVAKCIVEYVQTRGKTHPKGQEPKRHKSVQQPLFNF